MTDEAAWLRASAEGDRLVVRLGGDWTVREAADLDNQMRGLPLNGARHVLFDLSDVSALDTAGAWLVNRTSHDFRQESIGTELRGVAENFAPLMRVVESAEKEAAAR
ncbi:MAG: STAS domain-containing protein, partial [Alphaproteobacteria bacterium]|nr:STAS domain-containing protein [Alphaproteobacteria bacterium]